MRELAQHITDLLENSVRAGAHRVEIDLDQQLATDWLVLRVADDGSGMAPEAVARAVDPFFTSRTCRRVGLGLPLLDASARRSGGHLSIDSKPGKGTVVEADFRLSNIDTPPLGDLKTTLMCAIAGHPEVNLRYRHTIDGKRFEIDSAVIKSELGDVPLSHPTVLRWLEQHISDGLAEVGAVTAREEVTHAQAE
jgi:hypothetical protein